MNNNVTFHCSLENLRIDKEGEAKLTLTIPALEAQKIAEFYAQHINQLLSGALVSEGGEEDGEDK
jgi:hypothetical protein